MSNAFIFYYAAVAVLAVLILILFREVLRLSLAVEKLDESRAWHYRELSRQGYLLSSLEGYRRFTSSLNEKPAATLPHEAAAS